MIDIVVFILATVALMYLRWWISKRLHGVVMLLRGSKLLAVRLYALLFLPGVIIHEVSHFVMAAFMAVPTGDITIFPREKEIDKHQKEIALGSVQIAKTDFLRGSLIGFAPFIVGCTLLYACTNIAFPEIVKAETPLVAVEWFVNNLHIWKQATTWLWFYALLAISNTMFMSKSDMKSWPIFLLLLLIIAALVYMAADITLVAQILLPPIANVARALSASFLLVVLVDIVVMLLLYGVEQGLQKVTGKRVVYGSS